MSCSNNCKSDRKKLQRCSGFHSVQYCSRQCQLRKLDQLLSEIAKDEKTGFMQPKYLDDTIRENTESFCSYAPFGALPPSLPSVMNFMDPMRYLTHILDVNLDIIDEINKCKKHANSDMNIESTQSKLQLFKGIEVKHLSPCQEVFGVMQYLSMCAKIESDYLSFWNDKEFEENAVNKIHEFIHENKSTFEMLFVFMSLTQFNIVGGSLHYFCVIKLNNKYRLIQSFGKQFSLQQELRKRNWMNHNKIKEILNAFVYLESVGRDQCRHLNENELRNIAIKSKLCLGFELQIEPNISKRAKHGKMCAVIMRDLSIRHFVDATQHLLDYMTFLFKKFEKREFNHDDTPLCYRMGYPDCTDDEYMTKVNDKHGWGYTIRD